MTPSDIITISMAATTQADPWPTLAPYVEKYGARAVLAVVGAARKAVIEPSPATSGGLEDWVKE